MQLLVGTITILVGLTLVIFRRAIARRAGRLVRRRFGALGEENAKSITPAVYGVGGLVFVGLGVIDLVRFFSA